MGNLRSYRKRISNKQKVVKRTIKFLSVAPDSKVAKAVLQRAPDAVIRAISNAALNARQGAVAVPPQLKQLFRHHNHHFDYLIDRTRPIALKRRLVLQNGGALPIIVPLLATVLGSIGGEFISRIFRKNECSFSKKVLIEQAELDRLQQRQIRDYSPELQTMVRLQNQMRDIMARKKLTAEERINLISELQIRFDKLKKETGVLSGAMPPQAAPEAPPPPPGDVPNILAAKGIGPDAALEKKEKEQDEVPEKGEDLSGEASALSPMMSRIIRWNIPGLYHQKAHRLLKNIHKNPEILTRNENGEAVVYGESIPGSNFKFLFKSMVSNQQDLHQVGIDDFLRALRSLGIKKDDISGEPLKNKLSNVAPYVAHQRHLTSAKHEPDNLEVAGDNIEELVQQNPKQRVHKPTKRSSLQVGKGYIHKPILRKPPGRKANILYAY